jgi:hypothetical protein
VHLNGEVPSGSGYREDELLPTKRRLSSVLLSIANDDGGAGDDDGLPAVVSLDALERALKEARLAALDEDVIAELAAKLEAVRMTCAAAQLRLATSTAAAQLRVATSTADAMPINAHPNEIKLRLDELAEALGIVRSYASSPSPDATSLRADEVYGRLSSCLEQQTAIRTQLQQRIDEAVDDEAVIISSIADVSAAIDAAMPRLPSDDPLLRTARERLSKLKKRETLDEQRRNFEELAGTRLELPSEFKCAITLEKMKNPVVAADGISYERAAIEQWLLKNNSSPSHGVALKHKHLSDNINLRKRIEEYEAERYSEFEMIQAATKAAATRDPLCPPLVPKAALPSTHSWPESVGRQPTTADAPPPPKRSASLSLLPVLPPELSTTSFAVEQIVAPATVVAASSPIQKQATPCQSCGLKALTNLRCSRWSALPPQPEPACAACRQTHQTSQPKVQP